jgi:glycosyltransferase involved in cell wall biosynthesis
MHEIIDPLEESILPIKLYSRIMGKLLMKSIDVFVVHSHITKKQATEIYHLNKDSIKIILHGRYDTYYRDYDKQAARNELGIKEEFTILFFGMIRKYKGIPYLVEAFNKLPHDIARHCRLVIVGEDWGDETSLAGLINFSPYREHITYKPHFVPDDFIPKYFSAADVIVLPYTTTSGSGVANIAMAYGRSIITSDLEVMRECLVDYKGAAFVPVGDVTAIRENLLEIYGWYKTGKSLVYDPAGNTWDEVARQYEGIIGRL